MFRHFAACLVVETIVLFLAMTGGSVARAQYGDHSGHGHPSFGSYGTATMPRAAMRSGGPITGLAGLPPAYQPFQSHVYPGRAQVNRSQSSQNQAYSYPTSAPAVKPFSNYRPTPSVNPLMYQYQMVFRTYSDYKSWLGR